MVTGTLAGVGVEAVVEGFPEFQKNFGKMNSLLDSFTKGTETATRKMSPFSKILDTIGESFRRIAEFVVAGLIVRGIEKITEAISNMARAMFDAAAEFQNLLIRLEGLVALDIFEGGQVGTFSEALEAAVDPASELFFWIQKLALTTPFDVMDVANTVTLAKAYGLATDMAKTTTASIIDFASGMGLSDIQMRRVIENFGQMIQQGKVAGTELRDLGRGAFFPVNAVLERMAENVGLTGQAFEDFKGTAEGVDAFMEAFVQIVGERFPNAGQRASRTITAVVGNIKDLFEGVIAFNVLRPVLDIISTKMANFLDLLTTGERGDKLIEITKQMGENLAGIAEALFGITPSGEAAADAILSFLDRVKGIIVGIRTILEADAGGAEKAAGILGLLGLDPSIVGKGQVIVEKIKGFIAAIQTFWKENGEQIVSVARKVWEIFTTIVKFLIDHKELVLAFFAGWLAGKLILAAAVVIFQALLKVLIVLINPFTLFIAFIQSAIAIFPALLGLVAAAITDFRAFADLMFYIGKDVILGLWRGMANMWGRFVGWLRAKLNEIPQSIRDFFGIGSPSKMFAGFGENLMEGFALGIQKALQLPQEAMSMAVTHTLAPVTAAVQASPAAGTTITNNFTQTVNTQAKSSTVIPDFRSLQSMVGA